MATKFRPGDRVLVGPVLPPSLSRYPVGCGFIVYRHACRDEYTIDLDNLGRRAWYPGEVITLLSRNGVYRMDMPQQAHVKLHIKGSPEKIELFHFIAYRLDPDWPYNHDNNYTPEMHCGVCAGAIYLNPNMTADDLRALAKQVNATNRLAGGLQLQIKKFNVQARCTKDEETTGDTTETPAPEITGEVKVVTAEGE